MPARGSACRLRPQRFSFLFDSGAPQCTKIRISVLSVVAHLYHSTKNPVVNTFFKKCENKKPRFKAGNIKKRRMQDIRQAIKRKSSDTGTAFGIDNIIITRESSQYFPRGSNSKSEAQMIISYLRLKIKTDIWPQALRLQLPVGEVKYRFYIKNITLWYKCQQ